MRKCYVLIAVLTVVGFLGEPVLEACGAKFLVATRSARFQRMQRATRPANILVYRHTDEAGVVEFIAALESTLERAGHSVTLATSESALRTETQTGEFNVVMMQLDEARRLRSNLAAWEPGAAILPMAAFLTKPESSRAKQEFGQVLALPLKDTQLFAVVQGAVR
jgi:CheY-like chemotaxis protein